MIKKIIIILLFSLVIFSCGKKGDPEFKDSKRNTTKLKLFNAV